MQTTQTYVVNSVLNGFISPLDRGLAYGDGVFRTMKMVGGMPQFWPLHYQTLVADCGAIGIVCPSAELLMSDLLQLFTPDETAVAKIIITRGEGARGYALPAIVHPTRLVLKSAMPQYPSHFEAGITLTVCETRLAHQPRLAGVKHLNRLENVLARTEWNNPEIADGILLDQHNLVIECTAGNIFARFGNELRTPKLNNCGVNGVMRQRILALSKLLSLAKPLSLDVEEAEIDLADLLLADEVIICNSMYGAWQVTKIQDKLFNNHGLAKQIRELTSI